jgi:hypothetical protein
MKLQFVEIKGTWREVADAARTTVHLAAGQGEPKAFLVFTCQYCLTTDTRSYRHPQPSPGTIGMTGGRG